jgi:hypothetical protein
MIKLKDLLYEISSLNLLIPRKLEGRVEKYIQSKIIAYKKNNNVGDFDISELGLTELPASLKHLKIGGTFFCNNNDLTSLTNSPTSVGLDFDCSTNKLTSLTGAPTRVVGNFYCSTNRLDSLDGLIRTDRVRLSVGGYFYCSDNKVIFTKEQVRAVCDVTGKIYV